MSNYAEVRIMMYREPELQIAEVVELVDTLDLKSNVRLGRTGSSPVFSTDKKSKRKFRLFCFQKVLKSLFQFVFQF